jgi:hypothetical protein
MGAVHVTDRPDTSSSPSRRMWLAGLGGGLLSVPFLWWLEWPQRTGMAAVPERPEAPCCVYVDRDGWMLTPEDVAALATRPTVP